MKKLESTTSKNNGTAREETLETQKENLAKEKAFRLHRDEMSRLLLADYVESTLAHWEVWV